MKLTIEVIVIGAALWFALGMLAALALGGCARVRGEQDDLHSVTAFSKRQRARTEHLDRERAKRSLGVSR